MSLRKLAAECPAKIIAEGHIHYPEQAVKAALSDYYTRQGIDPEPIVGHVKKDVHEGEEAEGACPSCATCDH